MKKKMNDTYSKVLYGPTMPNKKDKKSKKKRSPSTSSSSSNNSVKIIESKTIPNKKNEDNSNKNKFYNPPDSRFNQKPSLKQPVQEFSCQYLA